MSAPASQAALASGQLVMPQILTRIMSCLNRPRGPSEKSSECGRGIGRKHQAFADEKSVEAGIAEFGKIVVSAEARFADGDASLGDAIDQFERGFDAQLQGFQIAIVDPDDACICGERAVELGGRVNFDQRLHLQLASESDQAAKKFVRKSSDNKEETVRVVRTRFPNLP